MAEPGPDDELLDYDEEPEPAAHVVDQATEEVEQDESAVENTAVGDKVEPESTQVETQLIKTPAS
jgi:hypothetical protein